MTIALETDIQKVGEMITRVAPHSPSTLVSTLADDFFRFPELDSVAVVEDARPVGLITRQKLLFTVFRRFGWEVYHRKAIRDLADAHALTVPASMRLDEALARAVDRRPEDVYDDLIVVGESGRYEGLLPVRQMIIHHSHALANTIIQKDVANARARDLEKIGEIKSRFIANVTHELRSPVNAIIELAEMLRLAAEEGYVAQMRDRLTLLLSSATNLRSIITNILDLSKIEAGKMQLIEEPFDLVPLLGELAETTRVLLGGKPVEVAVRAERTRQMVSDPVKCRQVILNLASNAAKFTERGWITIEQTFEDDHAVVRVIDTGIGIRGEDRERLFEPFTQFEDASSKRHQGTGIGLTITRELLDLLGGSIQVDSRAGEGSTFTVRIQDRSKGFPNEKETHSDH